MAYAHTFILALDPIFNQRITIAVIKAVRTVFSEDPQTTNHANREAWALRAIKDPQGMAGKVRWAIVTHPNVEAAGAEATDVQIQTAMDALINPVANANL